MQWTHGPAVKAPLLLARDSAMTMTYFKRYRMEFDLARAVPCAPDLADDYRLLEWDPALVEAHADAKYRSFRHEIDAHVFPCLADYEGCLRLMREISRREGFLSGATWLIGHRAIGRRQMEYCGTVQGIGDERGLGSIQNLGVTPEHRGLGLAKALMVYALQGFRQAGMRRVTLEVTGQNKPAVGLYEQLGFHRVRTVYKAVEVAYS
jgi:ribosomal protein S18 acetylase RimI-like enzyme